MKQLCVYSSSILLRFAYTISTFVKKDGPISLWKELGSATVDVIQRGEALAIFERDLIIHFQQISKAAALYVEALLGGIKRALEIYQRVDETTSNYLWSKPSTEELWHCHAEGVLMVALNKMNLPQEAWRSARLLRAILLSYHLMSPALSTEEAGLMTYLQSLPDAGPSVNQATSGLQNWKCAEGWYRLVPCP